MNARRLLIVAATGVAATTLVFAGCGGSSDTAASTAASTAAATTATTAGTAKQVDCVGADEACSVKIPIGGGASNQAYEVALTGTNLGEPTVTPSAADEKGSYEISNAMFTTGGSVYSFTLNAVESLPEGAYITLDFATKK